MNSESNKASQVLHLLVLQGLLLLGFMFHQAEDWSDRPATLVIFATLFLFVFIEKIRQWVFAAFLGYSIVVYADKMPNLANHSNLNFFVFLLIFPAIVKWGVFKKSINFKNLILSLRWTIVILYFFTIFHKLNWDFLNPESSCANSKLMDYLDLIPETWTGIQEWAYILNPYLGWLVEGLIPVALVISPLRNYGILLVVVLHYILAPMGFTDFSSLAMAFAWTFVDPKSLNTKNLWRHFQYLTIACLIMELGFGIERFRFRMETYEVLEGILFAILYTPFLWAYFKGQIDTKRLSLPKNWGYVLALSFLFFFGFNSYLGLRTAGNFSMFSNLTTEGISSNHIFLSSNPFKVFNFQDDVVEILEVSETIQGFHKSMPFPEQRIPRVEFARLVDIVRGRNWTHVEIKVRYQDKIYWTDHMGFDSKFDFDVPQWQKKLMKFRHIQPMEPQYCHW